MEFNDSSPCIKSSSSIYNQEDKIIERSTLLNEAQTKKSNNIASYSFLLTKIDNMMRYAKDVITALQLKRITSKVILASYLFMSLFPSSISANEVPQAHFVSSSEDIKRIVDGIRELEKKNLLDGKVLIAKGNQIAFMAQNRELVEMEEEPQFMIASISKQFFAGALLKLLYDKSSGLTEEEKIKYVKNQLAQPLCNFFPPGALIWNGGFPQWAQTITLHHLLSHTSGLADYTETKEYAELSEGGKKFFEISHSKSEIINLIIEKPTLFNPGTQYSYSNTNYVLIAEAIEILSHLPASTYLQQTIFNPLGLTSTFCPVQGGAETLKKSSHLSRLVSQWQYDLTDQELNLYPFQENENISNAIGSGSIISTTDDLLKWNLALHRDHSILPASLYKLMITPNIEGYGYGIGLGSSNQGMVYRHRGSIDAYRSRLYYFPEQDLSIVVLTSSAYDEEKLQKEKDKIILSLSDSFSQLEKEEKAAEQILEKYPDKRGFNLIIDLIDSNLKIEFIK